MGKKKKSDPSLVTASDAPTNEDEAMENITSVDSDFVQRAKNELSRISEDLKNIKVRKQELSTKEESNPKTYTEKMEVKFETEAEIPSAEKPFLLSEDGHTLTLPPRYRKLKASHYKFISKLNKGTETTDQSETFVRRLESQFDFNKGSGELVLNRVNVLIQAQKKLLVYLQWITERSFDDHETFSWQNVYKSYRHWQVLLGKFHELQKGTQELLTGEDIFITFTVRIEKP